MTALAVALPVRPAYVTDADASDERLVEMWLHGRSPHTIRAYRRAYAGFAAFVAGKPLRFVTLGDLQDFADSLAGAPSSRGQTLAAVKSLLSFGMKVGALATNVGTMVAKPKARDGLADRILSEDEAAALLAACDGRDLAVVAVLYRAALRVSEACALRWSDVTAAKEGFHAQSWREGPSWQPAWLSAYCASAN
jgi:site-specific recombinase XerD